MDSSPDGPVNTWTESRGREEKTEENGGASIGQMKALACCNMRAVGGVRRGPPGKTGILSSHSATC